MMQQKVMAKRTRAVSVKQVVESHKSFFKNKRLCSKVVMTFFEEAKKSIIDLKTIRFAGRDYGELSLIAMERTVTDAIHIRNKGLSANAMKTSVKPILRGFDVRKAGRIKRISKPFKIYFTYPRYSIMKELSQFPENKKRTLSVINGHQ